MAEMGRLKEDLEAGRSRNVETIEFSSENLGRSEISKDSEGKVPNDLRDRDECSAVESGPLTVQGTRAFMHTEVSISDGPSPAATVTSNFLKDGEGIRRTFVLAYQTLGVVFGGLGTSPLYVYPSINLKSPDEKDYLGILSLMFWTLSMIGVLKYVCIALHADDHGEGGTFALYSLLCRHANIGQHSGKHLESDANLSHFSNFKSSQVHSKLVQFLEKSTISRRALLFVSMLGTCMLIGDGILTPAISVLSAMSGLRNACPLVNQTAVITLSAVILIMLFLVQRFGTSRVSFLFSPIMVAWLLSTPMVGIYNIIVHYQGVFKALSPYYIFYFFQKNAKEGWLMLGGIVLCITGAEAMFADLGHFNRSSIQIAFLCAVYPSLIITYAGQTAYLIKNPYDHDDGFYKFIPHSVYWPMFVVSTLAAIVASQGLISASFSVIKQSVALDYFPRIKLVHTSKYKEGQIYSPEINYILMILCLAVILGFQDGKQIGNAFGVVVILVMLITTVLLTLVMIIIWRTPLPVVLVFSTCFTILEGVYVSAVLTKVPEGGWLPFAVSVILAIIMFSWNYGRQKKFEYEMTNKMGLDGLGALLACIEAQRVPGLCFFYSNILNGVPPILTHYVKNVRSLHQVIVFTTIRHVPVKTVLPNERFLVRGLGFKGVYRCIAQYGYKDSLNAEGDEFTTQVTDSLEMYIKNKAREEIHYSGELSSLALEWQRSGQDLDEFVSSLPSVKNEVSELENAKEAGVVYVLGKTRFQIRKTTSWFDRVLLGSIYRFLHSNCRSSMDVLKIPPSNFVEIGMLYEV